MDDGSGTVFGLDGFADPEQQPPPATGRATRWRIAATCAAVAVVLAGGAGAAVATSGGNPSTDAVVSVATSSSASAPSIPRTPAPTTTTAPTTQPTPTVPPAQLEAERADLQKTAALLPSGLRLTSPASWDRWLPAGKPYPGASTADDISTCPRIADRLASGMGQRMSYWIGTLPGEGGCVWAPIPLTNDNPGRYPYVFTISYLGSATTEDWRHHFYEHQGAICPDLDVPAVGPGAILVRCADPGVGYVLVLPDQRRPDGVWLIDADTRPNATRPATLAFTTLVGAAKGAYG